MGVSLGCIEKVKTDKEHFNVQIEQFKTFEILQKNLNI